MPNDPLSSPKNAAASCEDGGDRAVPAPMPAAERGRTLLTEYASHQTETQRLLATIARFSSTAHEQPPPDTPAAFARMLAEVAETIQQIETMLAANASATPDVYFAVERLQDIAMALRQREADAALCDGLEAAIREIGDAAVRHDTATTHVASATVHLCELRQRVDEVTTRGAALAGSPVSDEGLPGLADERLHGTRAGLGADVDGAKSLNETAGALPEPLMSSHQALPKTETELGAQEASDDRFEPVLLPVQARSRKLANRRRRPKPGCHCRRALTRIRLRAHHWTIRSLSCRLRAKKNSSLCSADHQSNCCREHCRACALRAGAKSICRSRWRSFSVN